MDAAMGEMTGGFCTWTVDESKERRERRSRIWVFVKGENDFVQKFDSKI